MSILTGTAALILVAAAIAVALVVVVRRRERTETWTRRAQLLSSIETERLYLGVIVDPAHPDVDLVIDCYVDEVRGTGADAVVRISNVGTGHPRPEHSRIPRELPITRITSVADHSGTPLRW